VDYDAVRAALAGLTAGQLAALVGATTVAYILNAGPARVLVPGLSSRRAVEADLVGRAVASTIPGPSDVAIKSVLFGQWKSRSRGSGSWRFSVSACRGSK
jgi:hypothetical protein